MRYEYLTRQFHEKEFGNMRFSVFNHIEDDGYVTEISALDNEEYGIDDFSFMVLDIPEEDRGKIRASDAATIAKYREFKRYVEKECQERPRLAVFIMKDVGVVVAVKLKTYNLEDFRKI